MRFYAILKGLLMLLGLVVTGFLIKNGGLGFAFDKSWIDHQIIGRGVQGIALFFLAATVLTTFGFPRQVISFLGGYAFGLAQGSLIVVLATVMGCVICFYYARFLGRDFVRGRYPEKVRRIDTFLAGGAFTMTVLIRFLPVGSNIVTNLAAGVSGVKSLPFFGGSLLGYLPQTAIFALIGSGIAVDPELRIGLGVVLFVVSGILGVTLYRKYRHGQRLDDAIEQEISKRS